MMNILSPTDKEAMVSSFLEIAVGHTVDTAHQFLKAANWRIEDAMQLFYVGNEGRAATSSSYVPPAKYTALLSDHKHSGLEEDTSNAYARQGDRDEMHPPLPVIREGLYDDASTHGSTRVVSPVMQFSTAEVAPAASLSGATPVTPASAPSVVRRKRRTHAEMVVAAQLCAADLMTPGITSTVTRRRRRSSPCLRDIRGLCPLREQSGNK